MSEDKTSEYSTLQTVLASKIQIDRATSIPKTTQEYSTSDTVLAAFLQCKGIPFLRVEKGLSIKFIFSEPPQELLSTFHMCTAEANVAAFFKSYKDMLKRVHGR